MSTDKEKPQGANLPCSKMKIDQCSKGSLRLKESRVDTSGAFPHSGMRGDTGKSPGTPTFVLCNCSKRAQTNNREFSGNSLFLNQEEKIREASRDYQGTLLSSEITNDSLISEDSREGPRDYEK